MVNAATVQTLDSIHQTLSYLGRNLGVYQEIDHSGYMRSFRQYMSKKLGTRFDSESFIEILGLSLNSIVGGGAGYGIGYNTAKSYGYDEETAEIIGASTGMAASFLSGLLTYFKGESIANKTNNKIKAITHAFDANRMQNNPGLQPVDHGDPIKAAELISLIKALQEFEFNFNSRHPAKQFVMNDKHAMQFRQHLVSSGNENAMIALIRLGADYRDFPGELVNRVLNEQTQNRADAFVQALNRVLPPELKNEIQEGLIEDLKIANDERSGRRKLQ